MPRSIVQYLEHEIARLETGVVPDERAEVMQASDILMQMPLAPQTPPRDNGSGLVGDERPGSGGGGSSSNGNGNGSGSGNGSDSDTIHIRDVNLMSGTEHNLGLHAQHAALRARIVSSRLLESLVSASLPADRGVDLLSRVRMGMTPSSAVIARGNKSPLLAANASKSDILLGATVLRSIPTEIVQRLVKRYLDTIHRTSPFLEPDVLSGQLQRVIEGLVVLPNTAGEQLDDVPIMADYSFLVVYLVLAISVTLGSANHGDEERGLALSLSLFDEGIHHLYGLATFPSGLAWLQIVLLVQLYATIFPRSANVWVLSGAAMRSCLELGLHREPSDNNVDLAPEELDLRRRVFWAAYCMDRSICSVLHRPLSTPDATISTHLPVPTTAVDEFAASIAYNQLLSEIIHVHYERKPPPRGLAPEEWVADVDKRLRHWHQSHGGDDSGTSLHTHQDNKEMATFALWRGLMVLHRPSPSVPLPSRESLLMAFEAATAAARLHNAHLQTGFFRRPWLSAHYTLEAATTVLFCLRHGFETIQARFAMTEVFEMTKLLTSNFLAIASRGWPDVSVYAGIYERLLGPLLERLFQRGAPLHESFGLSQDAELTSLLYPGPSQLEKLRFGPGSRADWEELGQFDFNLLVTDNEAWCANLGLGDVP